MWVYLRKYLKTVRVINFILYLCNRNRLCVIIEMLKSQIYVT